MPNPLRLGIFSSLQQVSDRQRGRKEHDMALQQALQDRERKQSLEEAMQARSGEQYEYQKSQRPLEEALKQAQIGRMQQAGAPKRPKPTQQNNTAEFMREGAERAVKTLEGYHAPAKTWIRNVPGLGNYGMGDNDQVAQNAAETLHDAYLRITTGATIGKDELVRAAKQYIAQPGDGEAVLRAKAARRAEIIRAIRHLSAPAREQGATEDDGDDERLPFSSY